MEIGDLVHKGQVLGRLAAELLAKLNTDFPEVIARVTPLEMGPPIGWPLRYRVIGPDPGKVRDIAFEAGNALAASPNTRSVNLTWGEPQRVVSVDLDQGFCNFDLLLINTPIKHAHGRIIAEEDAGSDWRGDAALWTSDCDR